MIQQIKDNKKLLPYLRYEIEDEGICVGIDESLSREQYVVVKVDDYYNGLHLSTPPKAIDFLAAVDCECDSYIVYLLELKNVKSPKYLIIKDIHEKFGNTIKDFVSERFETIFLNDKYKYRDLRLYLVSDAYGIGGRYENFEKYRHTMEKMNKKDTLKTEFNLGGKPYKFRNMTRLIQYDIPPNPIIRRIVT